MIKSWIESNEKTVQWINANPTKTKQLYHAALGKMLELTHRHSIKAVLENLAYHFEYAGIHGKAYAYLFLSEAIKVPEVG